jgi:hypothetical protein
MFVIHECQHPMVRKWLDTLGEPNTPTNIFILSSSFRVKVLTQGWLC